MNRASTPGPVLADEEIPFWRSPSWWGRIGRASIGLWVTTPLTFAGTVLAARALGPSGYGAMVLALSAVTLLATFLDVSLEEAVVHHGFLALANRDTGRLRALLRTAMALDIGIGVAVAAALVLGAGPVADVVSGGRLDPLLVRVAALSVLGATANGVTGGVLLLARRPDLRAWSMAWTALVRLGLVVVAVRVGGPAAVLFAFAAASVVGGGTQAIVAWRVGWRHWEPAPGTGQGVSVRALITFALHSSVTTSVIAVKEAIVSIFLGRVSGSPAVGTLNVAMLPVTVAAVATAPVRLGLFPEQARLYSEGRTSVLRRSIRGYTAVGLLLGAVGAVAAWFLLPVVLPALYSREFEGAIWPARILLVAAVGIMAVGWAKALPAAIGRPEVRTKVSLVELGLTAILMVFLARHGPVGAAVAISATGGASTIIWMMLGRSLVAGKGREDA